MKEQNLKIKIFIVFSQVTSHNHKAQGTTDVMEIM